MHKSFRGLLTVFLVACWNVPRICAAQNANAAGTSQALPGTSASKDQGSSIELLKHQIQLQQKQIEQLQSTLVKQQHALQRLSAQEKAGKPAQAASLEPAAANAVATKAPPKQRQDTLVASTAPPPLVSEAAPSSPQTEPNSAIPNSPIGAIPLKIGSATLTPVGFVDATAFFRSKNLGSGIGGSFAALPFSNTPQGNLSETRLTIQNSRIGMQLDDQFGGNKVRGYLETDFLGFQPVNAFVTSNSDSLRIRLYWLDLTRGKFEFLAGQSWSLLTPGRNGISPMPADIFFSQDMDTNYQVGLTWSRNLQFRFVYHPSNVVTAAFSLENPEQYVGSATFPSGFASALASETDSGGNTSTPNLFPDIVGKIAFDPMVGSRHMHAEFAGVLSNFRVYIPGTSSASAFKSTATGGGGSANFNLELVKNFHLIANGFYSDGGGRWIFGLGPDFIVNAQGHPSLVHAESGIGGFEYQATPKTLFYGYYGGAYFGRNTSIDTTNTKAPTSLVGFGYQGAPSSQNKSIQEGTFGIIQTFWKNEKYGALQLITQYSYLTRAPWYVAPSTPKNANLSEAYADIRYVLP